MKNIVCYSLIFVIIVGVIIAAYVYINFECIPKSDNYKDMARQIAQHHEIDVS